MACCIALALVISVVRTGWFRLVRGQAPPRAGFAPPARRLAPLGLSAPTLATTVATTPAPPITSPRSTWDLSGHPDHNADGDLTAKSGRGTSGSRPVGAGVIVALSAVIGLGLYSELLAALVHTDLVTVAGDRAGWRIREAALIAGSVAAALVAVASGLHKTAPRRRLALALTGGGGAWSLLSVLDMHLTGLVPENLVGPLTDLALHGPGFLAVTTGVGALLAGERWLNSLSPSTTRGSS